MLAITGRLGHFEDFFSRVIYPVWPLWVAGAIVVALLAIYFLYRRGWYRFAVRHPLASGVAAVVILAVTIPTGYYLASPLFERSLACERSPVAGAGAGSEKCEAALSAGSGDAPGDTASTSAPTTAVEPTIQPTFTARVTHQGRFHGADDFHFGRGSALLVESAPGQYVLRFEDFSVRNGPDLHVYLSTDPEGYGDNPLELGTLKATDGAFNYEVPPGTDISRFNGALVWCNQFSVLFATAPLTPAT